MSNEDLIRAITPLHGLWLGMLDDNETALVKEARRRGLVSMSYGNPAGVLGLAKLYVAALNAEPQQ